MWYAILILAGFVAGCIVAYLFLYGPVWRAAKLQKELDAKALTIQNTFRAQETQQAELDRKAVGLAEKERELEDAYAWKNKELQQQRAQFDARAVKYAELADENLTLKRDLQNIDVNLWKLQMDRDRERERQDSIEGKVKELGARYLKENIKWWGNSLTPNNYAANKKRLLDAIDRCRQVGFEISAEEEAQYMADLKTEYERIVRLAFEREEQARIKAQIREEQRLEREIEQELKRLDRERAAIQAALAKALAEAKDEHSAEVENLKARLAEAEAKAERAKSQAQLTKSGHVYVLSNIGSFGQGVYKIGMTRRLEPQDRVKELGDASVPFPFDVHMMISCDDAPKLENELHRVFHRVRVNKANPRKEYFHTDIEEIYRVVKDNFGEVQYLADPEALEYYQSINMSDEDSEFIESIYDEVEEESEAVADEA